MKSTTIQNPKLLLAAVLVILFTTITGFYLYKGILKSADEIVEDNKNFTRTAVAKLVLESRENLSPVWEDHLRGNDKITKASERVADSLLSGHVQSVLSNFYRVEGGFYFYELDEFIGYSFPTIAEPKPAFGPPPRSYNIIREQVRATVDQDSLLTKLHQFDPAIFPLSTQPIYRDGEIIGAAWARIHLERKLATSQSIQSGTFFLTIGAVLFGLAITVIIVWSLRTRIMSIKEGLNTMKHDPAHRLAEHGGPLGFISHSINELTDIQQKEQKKRKKLERELFQKEKMATLGNLIAGTAHEINTPISIIKTRIQIWERKLQQAQGNGSKKPLISDDSLRIVHDEIERVSDLIKRLLYFSKPVRKEKKPVDLHELLSEIVLWLPDAYPGYSLSFQTRWSEPAPIVLADRDSIEQVFVNVLKNAVEVSDKTTTVVIKTEFASEGDLVKVRIRDFGSGISNDIKTQVFDPFFTTKHSGSGLGLSISNEIIKAHHGTIYFQEPSEIDTPLKSENGYTTDRQTVSADVQSKAGTVCVITLPVIS